jgi:hypothetical protein
MPARKDGPASVLFAPLTLAGNVARSRLGRAGLSARMAENARHAPSGPCVAWGIPFRIGKVVVLKDKPVSVRLRASRARWLVFLHTSDDRPLEKNADGFIPACPGNARLGERAAEYVVLYADGSEHRAAVRRGYEIGRFERWWGENPVLAVADGKPHPLPAEPGDLIRTSEWARDQMRNTANDMRPWTNWLWAWQNPHPARAVVGVRFEPVCGAVVISAVSAGQTESMPLRWETRRKAVLTLPAREKFSPAVDAAGRYRHIQLDLGQVISTRPRPIYPNRTWEKTYNNRLPEISPRQVLVEYAAHPQARFHLPGGRTVPVSKVQDRGKSGQIEPVAPARRPVALRAVEKGTGKPLAVKLHVHGRAGEYLAPLDRQRIPNVNWLQDFNPDFAHQGIHFCTYIPGQTRLNLPLGQVYLEVSKGFEVRPVRKVVRVTPATREITVELEQVLPWRKNGWVSADTHVHVLSPRTGLLEGAGEGVNVVNLLATQWGEMMTNVADFDGATTLGSRQAGGDGEYLLRVGTENRQHVLGHISLLGYDGPIIAPITTGGADESAIGDAVEVLLSEWAQQCRRQGGLVVLPHFPSPRMEIAACLVAGLADGVEMTSWGSLYGGIDPYSLSDWYRFLNCGYMAAAVGGTDKMSSNTAVGTVRTYARLPEGEEFTYESWKQAVRRAETFVTYGPLLDFAVEGRPGGGRIQMTATGGTVAVHWEVASVTVPVSRVELVVNGEIRQSQAVAPEGGRGTWSVRLDRSSWLALLVRGHYPDKPEIIAAHSSPVAVEVEGTTLLAAADALTILEQIQGSLAYLDATGTRAETAAYKRMRMVLVAAGRSLHNRLHRKGQYHDRAAGKNLAD